MARLPAVFLFHQPQACQMPTLPIVVLFDRVEYGLNLALGGIAAKDFVEGLVAAGIVLPSTTLATGKLFKPEVDFVSEAGLQVRGQLALSQGDNGLTLTNASSLRVNGLRFLRGRLDFGDGPPSSLDGNDNLIGPFPEGRDTGAYLEMQLAAFGAALDQFLAAVCGAVPSGRVAGAIRVRSCELTHDMAVDDAPALGIALSHEALAGARIRHHSFHLTPEGATIQGSLVTCSWSIGPASGGLRLKTYAKSQGLLRLELMVRSRDGVRGLVQHGGGTGLPAGSVPSGGQAIAELRALLPAAADHLAGLWRHVAEVPPLNRSHLEFLVAMSPLLSVLFRPDGKSGKPLTPGNVTKTYDAIFQLMALGEYAPRQGKGQPLRDALEEMAGGEDAFLQRSPGHAVKFVVRSEWTQARLAVARMLA